MSFFQVLYQLHVTPSDSISRSWWYPLGGLSHIVGTHFTNSLPAHNSNFVEILYAVFFYCNDLIRSQVCTFHDNSAVMACANLWPDLIIISQIEAMHIFFLQNLGYECCENLVKYASVPAPVMQLLPIHGFLNKMATIFQWYFQMHCAERDFFNILTISL